ncbi:MAG: hypothetical protein QGH60_13905 [Phycisphaerae bacterium]|nr:hypothetical protein [Phycisphaerae bacterium]
MTLTDYHDLFARRPDSVVSHREAVLAEKVRLEQELSDGHIAHCPHPETHGEVVVGILGDIICESLLLCVYEERLLSRPAPDLYANAQWALDTLPPWLRDAEMGWRQVVDMCVVFYKTQSFLPEALRCGLREYSVWFGRSVHINGQRFTYDLRQETYDIVRKAPEYRTVRAIYQARNPKQLERKVSWLVRNAVSLCRNGSQPPAKPDEVHETVSRELAYIESTDWRGLAQCVRQLQRT